MRSLIVSLLSLCAAVLTAQSNFDSKIAPELRAAFSQGQAQDVLVVFATQADVTGAAHLSTKEAKGQFVFSILKAHAEQEQAEVRAFLHLQQARANSFYLVNAIAVQNCTGALAQALAQFDKVKAIALDPKVEFQKPEVAPEGANSRAGVEWGVQKIGASTVWDAWNITGKGVTIGGADTGYDWEHPAIKPHYKGYDATTGAVNHNYHWHDAIHGINPLNGDPNNPCGIDIDAPCDDQSHGTHTMGTMTGDDGQGNQIGVAPGASWVGCRNMERGWGQPSTYIECFEWFLAPTDVQNQNPDPSKSPDVINNSWYCAVSEGCADLSINELMRQAVINLKAAGVVVVVSNGNFGSQGCNSTYGPPAYFAESFSIGSTQESDTISNFSSRGPVTIDSSFRVKPDVCAPGQWVRSCTPGNNYSVFSGTSMAGPHVAGAVALMLEANPSLRGQVEMVESLLKSSAVPLNGLSDCSDNNGTDYPNNTYGYGRIDAYQAVFLALISSAGELNKGLAVRAFPNPVQDRLFLQFGENQAGICRLYNAQGQLVASHAINVAQGETWSMALHGLPQGVYVWQVAGQQGRTAQGRVMYVPQ